MTEKYDSNFLPQVEEADLALVLFSDITDPTHLERWEQFVKSQPILAKEILKRAYITSEASLGSRAMLQVILDAVSFTHTSLLMAAQRERDDTFLSIDDVDVASRLPSDEQSDDQ